MSQSIVVNCASCGATLNALVYCEDDLLRVKPSRCPLCMSAEWSAGYRVGVQDQKKTIAELKLDIRGD